MVCHWSRRGLAKVLQIFVVLVKDFSQKKKEEREELEELEESKE